MSKNKPIAYIILWDAAKAVLREKYLQLQITVLRKTEINNLNLQHQTLETEKQTKLKSKNKEENDKD